MTLATDVEKIVYQDFSKDFAGYLSKEDISSQQYVNMNYVFNHLIELRENYDSLLETVADREVFLRTPRSELEDMIDISDEAWFAKLKQYNSDIDIYSELSGCPNYLEPESEPALLAVFGYDENNPEYRNHTTNGNWLTEGCEIDGVFYDQKIHYLSPEFKDILTHIAYEDSACIFDKEGYLLAYNVRLNGDANLLKAAKGVMPGDKIYEAYEFAHPVHNRQLSSLEYSNQFPELYVGTFSASGNARLMKGEHIVVSTIPSEANSIDKKVSMPLAKVIPFRTRDGHSPITA